MLSQALEYNSTDNCMVSPFHHVHMFLTLSFPLVQLRTFILQVKDNHWSRNKLLHNMRQNYTC